MELKNVKIFEGKHVTIFLRNQKFHITATMPIGINDSILCVKDKYGRNVAIEISLITMITEVPK